MIVPPRKRGKREGIMFHINFPPRREGSGDRCNHFILTERNPGGGHLNRRKKEKRKPRRGKTQYPQVPPAREDPSGKQSILQSREKGPGIFFKGGRAERSGHQASNSPEQKEGGKRGPFGGVCAAKKKNEKEAYKNGNILREVNGKVKSLEKT